MIGEYISILKTWKETDQRKVTGVLQQIKSLNDLDNDAELADLTTITGDFHKQILQAEEHDVDAEWFEAALKAKAKLKKLSEKKKVRKEDTPKPANSQPVLVDYPASLTKDRPHEDNKALKFLYSKFILHMDQADKEPAALFVRKVHQELKRLFPQASQIGQLGKRIDSIATQLSKEGCTKSKQEMLAGLKTALGVAQNLESSFVDAEMQRRIDTAMKQLLEASQTGFYEQMKKLINKNASEECRYCHKPAAYCEDMKQIRASDEPMTRFMKCNNCNKGWRD